MSLRELGWVLLGVCSALGCARERLAAKTDPPRPAKVSISPPGAPSTGEPAPGEPPVTPIRLGDRASFYGLSMELPAGWRDETMPAFESESALFRKIDAGRPCAELPTSRARAPRRRHEFLPDRGERVHIVVAARAEPGLLFHVNCRSNCDAALAELLVSLRRATAGAAPPLARVSLAGKYVHRAYEWEFETGEN